MNLRELFINWLTASRFIRSLESRIAEQRNDFTERLLEKDSLIKQFRVELAGTKLECDRMRSVLMPFGSAAGAIYAQRYDTQQEKPPVVPEFTGPDDWSAELNKLYEKEKKDGSHGNGRKEVHQPPADDATQ